MIGTAAQIGVAGSRAGSGWSPPPAFADPAGAGRQAARQVASQAPGWWLHIDLDVLDREEFSSCGAAGEVMLPGGCRGPNSAPSPHQLWEPAAFAGGASAFTTLTSTLRDDPPAAS